MLTDEQLVARAQKGDQPAMDAILDRFEGAAIWNAAPFYDHTADREDLQQEARIGILKAVRDYRPEQGTSFNTFAFLCCRRQVITAVKTSTRGKHDVLTFASRIAVNDDGDEIAAVEAAEDPRADTPSLTDARRDLATVMRVVNDRLSPLERQCLLGVWNGESHLDLQRRLGHPLTSWADGRPRAKVVENAWQRAQLKLKAALAEADGVPLGRAA